MVDVNFLERVVEALDPSALAEFRLWFVELDTAACDRNWKLMPLQESLIPFRR